MLTNVRAAICRTKYNKFLDSKENEDPEIVCKEFIRLSDSIKKIYNSIPNEEDNKKSEELEYYEEQINVLKNRITENYLKEHGYNFNDSFLFSLEHLGRKRWDNTTNEPSKAENS